MNYYNPYYMMAPLTATRPGLFGMLSRGAGRGITLSSIINGTQRTLGLVNQAIPLVKQVTPVMKNAKTMFRVMNEFKKVDAPTTNNSNVNSSVVNDSNQNLSSEITSEDKTYVSNGGPTFFA